MLPPTRAIVLVVCAAGLAASCQSADSRTRQSTSSSTGGATTPATNTAVTPRAGTNASAVPTDSISALADRGRIQGNAQAPLWIVEASDFQCPYCKTWHDSAYAPLVAEYVKTGKVRIAYLNFPLNQHQNAMPAAEAAMCASVQDKFWPMHDALFTSQQQWENRPDAQVAFDTIAARLGVIMPTWRDCVSRHLTRALIEADYARSQSAGVKSTPTFFVGDQQVAGAQPYGYFRQIIEAQLAKRAAGR